jgi:hypothetical protein
MVHIIGWLLCVVLVGHAVGRVFTGPNAVGFRIRCVAGARL